MPVARPECTVFWGFNCRPQYRAAWCGLKIPEALGLAVLQVSAIELPLCLLDFRSLARCCKELRAKCNDQMQAEHQAYVEATALTHLVDIVVFAYGDETDSDPEYW